MCIAESMVTRRRASSTDANNSHDQVKNTADGSHPSSPHLMSASPPRRCPVAPQEMLSLAAARFHHGCAGAVLFPHHDSDCQIMRAKCIDDKKKKATYYSSADSLTTTPRWM